MTRKSKDVGEAPSINDLTDALAGRYTSGDTDATEASSAMNNTNATHATAKASAKRETEKVRRSWLLPRAVADQLAEAADDLHYGSRGRVGKSEAQAAIILAGLRHLDEVHTALSATADTSQINTERT